MSEPTSRQRAALAVLCVVLFLTFLDNTIVSVTLASIQSHLGAGVQTLQWVVNGYALTFACFMLAGGTFGDIFGRKRVMLLGIAIFCGGSVLAALAPGANWLLAGRVVMGVGAAASEPGTLSMVRHVYPDRRPRARALGVWAAVSGTALALGPVIAGVIVGFSDWRGVFWFNLAFGGAAFIAAFVVLPESADPEHPGADLQGLALGALALASAIFAVIAGETAGFSTWWIVALFVLSGVSAAAFVVVELRAEHPLLELRYFRNGAFAASNVVAFTTYFGVFSIFFFVALYLQLLANQSPFGTALDFVPMTVAMIGASVATGYWVARRGPRVPMTVGCLLAATGILVVDRLLGPNVGFAQLGWSLPIAGAGFGIALVPVTSAALSSVPEARSGMAAAATNTSRELGAVFGVAVLGALVNAQLTSNLKLRLHALGIPASFDAIVIHAVTHGTAPSNAQQAAKINPAAAAAPELVAKVLHAAERAFYSGLHLALLISAALLFAGAVVAFVGSRNVALEDGASASDDSGDTATPVDVRRTVPPVAKRRSARTGHGVHVANLGRRSTRSSSERSG
jgi:EmrB/QacA subfamily drug resistance transporter